MSLAVTSVALQASGMVTGAISSYYSAKSQKSALEFQAGIADINARMSDLSAKQALAQGEREQQKVRMGTASVKSAQRVALAANGIDIAASPTALAQLTTTDVIGEIDANTVAENAIRNAWGYRVQAGNSRGEALVQRAAAKGIKPGQAAVSSLLGGSGQVASSWYQMNKEGAFSTGGGSAGGDGAAPSWQGTGMFIYPSGK